MLRFACRSVALALALFVTALAPSPVLAEEGKTVVATATGQIVSQEVCGVNLVCQVALVSGSSTRLGRLVGELHETVDIVTGQYTGTAVFTTTDGSAISTAYVGQVISQTPDLVTFVENHQVVGATGRLTGTTGNLDVLGTADATGKVSIDGSGVIFN